MGWSIQRIVIENRKVLITTDPGNAEDSSVEYLENYEVQIDNSILSAEDRALIQYGPTGREYWIGWGNIPADKLQYILGQINIFFATSKYGGEKLISNIELYVAKRDSLYHYIDKGCVDMFVVEEVRKFPFEI